MHWWTWAGLIALGLLIIFKVLTPIAAAIVWVIWMMVIAVALLFIVMGLIRSFVR